MYTVISIYVLSLYGSVHSLGSDPTLVGIVTGHLDVSLLAPRGAPTVLKQPVLLPLGYPISNDEEGMGEFGPGATGLTIDTVRVELEGGGWKMSLGYR